MPVHLRKYCYQAARNHNDVFVEDDWCPRPVQTRVFCLTTPWSCEKVLRAAPQEKWSIKTGKQGKGSKEYRQYGARHSRVIFDEAHYFKTPDTKIMQEVASRI